MIWLKDDREILDNDDHKYVVYSDGGVALRLSNVRPQDAGEYTCLVRNNFGEASSNGLFIVQDYKGTAKLAPQFTKTPVSVVASKGDIACFCARVQCGKPMEITWTMNGKDVKENPRCKIEKDDSVSILRIHGVQPRDVGEIRCTASVSGKGPSISCTAELRLNRAATHENRNEKPPNCNRSNSLRKTRKDVPPLVESPTRASRSSSLPRRSTPSPNLSPLPMRRNIPPSPLLLDRRTKLADKTGKRKDLNLKKFSRKATQRVYRESGDRASSDEEEEAREMFEGKRCETKLLENEGEL
uniref:Titin n=1 Tax=Apis cerana TaxID=7461 RepID=V9IEG4_APICE